MMRFVVKSKGFKRLFKDEVYIYGKIRFLDFQFVCNDSQHFHADKND